ncbi:hypothetical protein AB0J38_23405 [Streptomyces sp. NPDC050095]|uniref:hypothetical protein n=1 Tax=unclassified Streptomyces TaxID=2593676 RepID=UPI0034245366
MAKTTATTRSEGVEYVTYAPDNKTRCTECGNVLGTFDLAYRGGTDQRPKYRHVLYADCKRT